MKANPGGMIPPDQVIGRDQLISNLWSVLEQQSVTLSAERRMGKTTVIRKMAADGNADQLIIFRDVENVRSPVEFVELAWQDIENYLSNKGKARRVRDFLSSISGVQFAGIKFPDIAKTHWKTLLTKAIEDLVENQDCQVVFLWDEIPFMLDNIDQEAAMEMLDTLRSLRQTYPDVRMVFTGSIGLHHIIKQLRQAGYSGEPTNDMYPMDVPPLSLADATELTIRLIQGENIATLNLQITAKEIAEAVGCIPFYIHHVVNRLKFIDGAIDRDIVTKVINDSVVDALNPWQMDHYRDRINNYYGEKQQVYALEILDILAIEPSLTFHELWNRLSLNSQIRDKEMARTILRLLVKDYYLIQEVKAYSFRYQLVGKYWELSRDLE
ncbi:MAG: ATP-binding protein [Cyanobacteria bacterium P01_F01_bin.143]